MITLSNWHDYVPILQPLVNQYSLGAYKCTNGVKIPSQPTIGEGTMLWNG
jgi:hypothetical protein